MCPELHSVKDDKSTAPQPSNAIDKNLLVDTTFDPKKAESYHLSTELGTHAISFCVLDTLSNKYIALYQDELDTGDLISAGERLIELVQNHQILSPKYKSASLALVGEQFTTVPEPLFDKSKVREFLDFNVETVDVTSDSIEVLTDRLQSVDAFNLYAVPRETLSNIRSVLGGLKIMHHTSSLVDTLMNLNKNQNRDTCFLHIQKGLFSIVVINGNELKFCNNFVYNSVEDLAYYTLFVFEQLNLNPESVDTSILGEFGKNSKEYEILYTYIRNLRFIERNGGYTYSYVMDQLPGHYHFNLFSQYNCVS